jgi:hypothetical protein
LKAIVVCGEVGIRDGDGNASVHSCIQVLRDKEPVVYYRQSVGPQELIAR